MMDPLENNIRLLQIKLGDSFHLREAEKALSYLLEHADAAYPRLLHLLNFDQAENPIAIVDVLPQFGRPESIESSGTFWKVGLKPSLKLQPSHLPDTHLTVPMMR
jgi:hypothetical protein